MRRLAPPTSSCSRRKAMRFAALAVTMTLRSPRSLIVSLMCCGSIPPQGYSSQGYSPQGYSPQGYSPQGYSPGGTAVSLVNHERSYHPADASGRDHAGEAVGVAAGVGEEGDVAVDVDAPQRQPSAPEPGRAQGWRAPGVERLGGDRDDRALSRRAAAARPGRGQAARGAGVPCPAIPAGSPEPRQARTLPRPRRR